MLHIPKEGNWRTTCHQSTCLTTRHTFSGQLLWRQPRLMSPPLLVVVVVLNVHYKGEAWLYDSTGQVGSRSSHWEAIKNVPCCFSTLTYCTLLRQANPYNGFAIKYVFICILLRILFLLTKVDRLWRFSGAKKHADWRVWCVAYCWVADRWKCPAAKVSYSSVIRRYHICWQGLKLSGVVRSPSQEVLLLSFLGD